MDEIADAGEDSEEEDEEDEWENGCLKYCVGRM